MEHFPTHTGARIGTGKEQRLCVRKTCAGLQENQKLCSSYRFAPFFFCHKHQNIRSAPFIYITHDLILANQLPGIRVCHQSYLTAIKKKQKTTRQSCHRRSITKYAKYTSIPMFSVIFLIQYFKANWINSSRAVRCLCTMMSFRSFLVQLKLLCCLNEY